MADAKVIKQVVYYSDGSHTVFEFNPLEEKFEKTDKQESEVVIEETPIAEEVVEDTPSEEVVEESATVHEASADSAPKADE